MIDKINANLDNQIGNHQEAIEALRRHKEWFVRNQHLFTDELPKEPSFCGNIIDFDNCTHPQVIQVIKAFPGRWTKKPAGDAKIHYSNKFDGMTIRCYAGEPPPNCKIVYEEVTIPARTERRAKLICQEREPIQPVSDEIPF